MTALALSNFPNCTKRCIKNTPGRNPYEGAEPLGYRVKSPADAFQLDGIWERSPGPTEREAPSRDTPSTKKDVTPPRAVHQPSASSRNLILVPLLPAHNEQDNMG